MTEYLSSCKVSKFKSGARVKHVKKDKVGVIHRYARDNKWLVEWDGSGFTQLLPSPLVENINVIM